MISKNMGKVEELEWYVRDHISRYYNTPNSRLDRERLVDGLSKHVRYKNETRDSISSLMEEVLNRLHRKNVISMSDDIILNSTLERYQCKDCMYVSYLSKLEELQCARCNSSNMSIFRR